MAEVESLLAALESQAGELSRLGAAAQVEATPLSFTACRRFLDRVQSYRTLAGLIDLRLAEVTEQKRQRLRRHFDELTVLVFRTILATLAVYCQQFARLEHLPMGQDALFRLARRLVADIAATMDDGMRARVVDGSLPMTEDALLTLIDELMARSPAMVDYADNPPAMVGADLERRRRHVYR